MIKVTHFHGMSELDIKNKVKETRRDFRLCERWICINSSVKGLSVPQITEIINRSEETVRE
jgi:hypothetical protein